MKVFEEININVLYTKNLKIITNNDNNDILS